MERHHGHWLAFVLNYFLSLVSFENKLSSHSSALCSVNMSAHRQDKLKLPKKYQRTENPGLAGWLLSDKIFISPPPPPHHHINKPTENNHVIQVIHITYLGIINIQTKNLERKLGISDSTGQKGLSSQIFLPGVLTEKLEVRMAI